MTLYGLIQPTFQRLAQRPDRDASRPEIEFYRRHDLIDLLRSLRATATSAPWAVIIRRAVGREGSAPRDGGCEDPMLPGGRGSLRNAERSSSRDGSRPDGDTPG
jgi:hypothetical protein